MIGIQGLPTTGCNVFYGNYIDNYNSNIRSRYYIYDGQAVLSSTSSYASQPTGTVCMNSQEVVYAPLIQTALIIAIIVAIIAVFISAYSVIIKPFIKVKRG